MCMVELAIYGDFTTLFFIALKRKNGGSVCWIHELIESAVISQFSGEGRN